MNEADLTLDYTRQFRDLQLSLGYTYLTFPNTNFEDTQEVYAAVGLDAPLNPSITAIRDFDEVDGNYFEAAVSHSFDIGIPLNTGLALGYNDEYMREDSGLSHAEARVSSTVSLTDNLTLVPMINYSHALDEQDFEDELWGGIGLNFDF